VARGQRLVLALAALLFLWYLGGHDLWAPDEPYFAEGAREMVADGQWWVPHVNGVVTTDKPPLFFWLIALGSLPFGRVTPWTARLPSALAALGTVLLVMRLGRRFGGERVAWLAGLTVATTVMFWDKARWSQIDSLLCFLIWAALSAFEAWRAGDADGRRAGLLFWLASALAVLAKGPVGFLLPLGIALTTLAFDRRLRRWRRFAPVSGPLLFAVVVAAWMVAATVGGGGEYSVWGALKEHFLGRAVHGMHHRQPPWYFLQVLPVQLLPWSGLVPGALVLAWRRRRPGDRFLLVASLFVVAFFSISPEKRELYALPAVPAFALLVALSIEAVAGSRRAGEAGDPHDAEAPPLDRRWLFGGQVAVGALLTLVGAALPVAARGREEAPYWMALALAALLRGTGLATLWASRRSRPLAAALTPAAGLAAGYLFAVTCLYPALEPVKSARPFAERMAEATAGSRALGHRVVALDLSNLPEAFAFYSDGVYTVETQDPARLAEHLSQADEVWAVTSRTGFEDLPADTRERAEIVDETQLGRRDVLLVRNR
jgi:4-amino-4-deoxy-L-arabinose transferase-like glycosyltransferase